jgi:hypothetical protein
MGRYWFCYSEVEHIHYFSRKSLEQYLRSHGFRIVRFKPHWKSLELGFAYHQMQFFGREIHRLLSKVEWLVPRFVMRWRFPLYGGEMLMLAIKE